MAKEKSGFRRLFSRNNKNCCSVEIEEVKKEEDSSDKSNEFKSKKNK